MSQVQRYKLVIQYIGTRFFGWQRQKSGLRTGQGVLEAALAPLQRNGLVSITSASRLDRGVHALGQVCHADLARDTVLSGEDLCRAVNWHLRRADVTDLQVSSCTPVSSDFHARFDAVQREYIYRVRVYDDLHSRLCIWHQNRAWQLRSRRGLDIPAMTAATRVLQGQHNFSAFQASGCLGNPERNMMEASLHVEPACHHLDTSPHPSVPTSAIPWYQPEVHGTVQNISLKFRSDGFVYHQVRLMVNAIFDVGRGRLKVDDISRMLGMYANTPMFFLLVSSISHQACSCTPSTFPAGARREIGPANLAPSHGLYLTTIEHLPGLSASKPHSKRDDTSNEGG